MNDTSATRFAIEEVFYLRDGCTVFAGRFLSGSTRPGRYQLVVEGLPLAILDVGGKVHFSPNRSGKNDLYTFTPIPRDSINLSGAPELVYLDECD